MNKSEETSTHTPRPAAARLDVCPLCREPIEHGDSTAEGERPQAGGQECRVCKFRFAVDGDEEREALPATPPAAEAVLEKWLSGAPLIPARPSAWKQASRWVRRHRSLAGTAGALAAAAVLGIVHLHGTCRTLEESLLRTTLERDEALGTCEQMRVDAEEFARSVDEHVDESFRRSERDLRVSIAREVAVEAATLSTRQPEHGLAMATVALRMAHRESAPPIVPALELVYGLSTRPMDETGETLGRVDVLAISPDGTRLAAADADGQVRLVDLTDELEPVSLPGRLTHAVSLAFSPDGLRLVARSADSTISIWRVEGEDVEKQERTVLKVPESRVAGSAMSDDNRWILAGCNGFRPGETTVRLWDVASRNPNTNYFDLPGNRGRIQSVAVSRNAQWAAAGNHGGTIALWNIGLHPLRDVTTTLQAGRHGVNSLLFTPDGRKLVTSEGTDGGECLIRVWDLTGGKPAAAPMVLEGHVAPVRKLAVSANGRCVASADDTGRVRIWNIEQQGDACVANLEAHVDAVTALEFGVDGRRLYSAGLDGQICVWDLTRMPIEKPLVRLRAGESAVTGLAVSRDGRKLAAASADQNARLWLLAGDDLLRWAHDGSRRQPGALTPLVDAEPSEAPAPSTPPVAREMPIIETAERPDLNPLR
jgi:WD40 repeat protein